MAETLVHSRQVSDLVGSTFRYHELQQHSPDKAHRFWAEVTNAYMFDLGFTPQEFEVLSFEADENIRAFNTQLNELGA